MFAHLKIISTLILNEGINSKQTILESFNDYRPIYRHLGGRGYDGSDSVLCGNSVRSGLFYMPDQREKLSARVSGDYIR